MVRYGGYVHVSLVARKAGIGAPYRVPLLGGPPLHRTSIWIFCALLQAQGHVILPVQQTALLEDAQDELELVHMLAGRGG